MKRVAMIAAAALVLSAVSLLDAQETPATPTMEVSPLPVLEVRGLTGEPVALSLREVVLTTLAQNLDMRIVRKERDAAAEDVWGAYGIYDPLLEAGVTRVRVDQQTGLRPDPTSDDQAVTYTDSTRTEASVSQRTPLGTQLSVFAADVRTRDREPFAFGFSDAVVNPEYNSSAGVRVTQPLLKNYGPLVNNAEIRVNKRRLAGQNLAYREVVQELVAAVMTAYWDLDFAIRNLDVQRQALVSADELLRVNRRRFDVGDMPRLGVVQAEAQVAQRQFLMAAAEANVVAAQDRLLALMNWQGGAKSPDAWDAPVLPTDAPTFHPQLQLDAGKIVQVALTSRPDYLQDEVALEIAKINRDVSRRQRLPELNAFAGYTVSGLEDNRWESYDTLRTTDYAGYNFGVEFRYPLFNRRAKAEYQKSLHRVDQAELRIENRELQVLQEARAAIRNYRTSLDQIEAASRQVVADEEKVSAERKRLEVGQGTVFEVLNFEDDLAESRANLARAMANYQIALVELARSSGILLDVQGIMVEDQSDPRGKQVWGFAPEEGDALTVGEKEEWLTMLRGWQD